MGVVFIIFIVWSISAISKGFKRAKAKKEAERIAYEKRLAAFEREQAKIRKEQEKHAAQLAKHNARIIKQREQMEKFRDQLDQAAADIDTFAYMIEEAQKYSKFLEENRDKCSAGGAEYFKWQNKLTANDNKIYNLNRRMNAAASKKKQAEIKLSA